MYGVTIGETLIRVVAKEDAMALVGVLFDLDCTDRVSSKPMAEQNDKKEDD